MKITGIICEYNPLHLGHKKQLDLIRADSPDGGIVCLMSGNFVQRGMPAVFSKAVRAEAAVKSGADLVLELPVTAALSSAEGFAAGGVSILSGFCDRLCFGAETASKNSLIDAAKALLSADFSAALRQELEKGLSFPAARQKALEHMGIDGALVASPNNILAVEYCKAILAQNSNMEPMPILRQGDYHNEIPDTENPSATAVRQAITAGGNWQQFVPKETVSCFENAAVHSLKAGEQAMLYRLRTMTEEEFASLPYGSEGLWRKLMHAARSESTLDNILEATKSKRYTRTRLDRMVMCAFLGITEEMIASSAPYTRVLAFNDRGREILKKARLSGVFPNIGEKQDHPYQALEDRCGDLYGLFCETGPEAPGSESRLRITHQK
ncbi:MAG: nucleotidyltransferase family protein [Oscillospiraceae bacterium]|nr:nucleotidyltransferase family protein [Oscillospiraceae bacterium]